MLTFLIVSLFCVMISLGWYVFKFSFALFGALVVGLFLMVSIPIAGIILDAFIIYILYKLIFD